MKINLFPNSIKHSFLMNIKPRSILLCVMLLSLCGCTTVTDIGSSEPLVREHIEWCNIWLPYADKDELPRVLIVGDSITVGYYPLVEKQLDGIAYCGRLSTSRCVSDPVFFDELLMVLRQYHFDVVHFNNGLHGFGYTEASYNNGIVKLFDALKENTEDTALIWANSTPMREKGNLDKLTERTERVIQRNKFAREVAMKHNIPINDLFSAMIDHPEFQGSDGVHFNAKGKEVQAKLVTDIIRNNLNKY